MLDPPSPLQDRRPLASIAWESWRSDLLALVLRFAFWIGLVVYAPSAWAAVHFGEPVVLVVDTIALSVLALLAFSSWPSQPRKAQVFCGIMYGLGCLLLLRVGAVSQIYLFAASMFATLLLGKRAGLSSVALNFVSMVGLGYLSFAAPGLNTSESKISPTSWVVQTLNFSFLNLVLTLAVAAVISAIESALARALEARDALEKESLRLKAANHALREKDEILESARKMDAVGRLAGGVAHDFNNMLNVILGHAELALADLPPESDLRDEMEQILKAGERSAALTRQLLAFARKQTVSPRSIDLNRQIRGMLTMLRRLIGEEIELSFEPSPDTGTTVIDPSQLDQILANLAVNARDAIDGVGKVTVRTARVKLDERSQHGDRQLAPGEYVSLRVADTGAGMDEETRSRLFEPFFTTKKLGVGTGLGLSTVYGIVGQNQGIIRVKTEPGVGTEFEILLPGSSDEQVEIVDDEQDLAPPASGERILLVEDEPTVLKLAELMLTRAGYEVKCAITASVAIDVAKAEGPFELLITDVIMPEMSGREVYRELSRLQPGLRCLYVSGYTADVIAERGVLPQGTFFLQKPFSMDELANKVRSVLDGERD